MVGQHHGNGWRATMGDIGLDKTSRRRLLTVGGALAVGALSPATTLAASAYLLDQDADAALATLYATNPRARELARVSRAVLVFPKITKAGLMIGGQTGDGVMRVHGRTVGYYNTSAASYGLQVGVQTFSYVLFFISQSSLDYLRQSKGWQIGSGPSVVVLDQGAARSINTTSLTQDVYAMVFGQRGLMAGIGLEGSKITPIHPGP
jgi:lipid-binding SYLF domain-containing protein